MKKLLNKVGPKLAALALAVLVWLIGVNLNDPVKTVTFSDVPVSILHSAELTSKGMVYEVVDDTDSITVSVTGRRSVIEDMSKDNIIATADMNELTNMSTIGIKVSTNKYANDISSIKSGADFVKLSVENSKKIFCPISVDILGEVADGYVLGDYSLNLNQVSVEGPESIVSTISSAKVELDVHGVINDINTSLPVKLYDAEGKEIKSERISLNVNNLSVAQTVLPVKEVPIIFNYSGIPAEGYSVTGEIKAEKTSVVIAARQAVLDRITSIETSPEDVRIDGATGNIMVNVSLLKSLPDGVVFAEEDFSGNVVVTVEIQKEIFKVFSFYPSEIRYIGLPADLKAEVVYNGNIKEGENILKVYGLSSALEDFDSEGVTAIINFNDYLEEKDLTELKTGIVKIEPSFGIPEGTHLKDSCEIDIRISKK